MDNHDWTPVTDVLAKLESIDGQHAKKRQAALVELGRELVRLREQYPSNKAFGAARKDVCPALRSAEVSACMWLARDLTAAQRRELFRRSAATTAQALWKVHGSSFASRKTPEHQPRDDTQDTPASTPASEQAKAPREKVSDMMGIWQAAAEAGSPWSLSYMRNMRTKIVGALGKAPPRMVKRGDPVVDDVVRTIREMASPASVARAEGDDMAAEVQRRVDEAIGVQMEEIKRHYRQLDERRQKLDKKEKALRAWQARLGVSDETVLVVLGKDDYRRLMSALHPDRYPESVRAKLNGAAALLTSSRLQ